MFRTEIPIEKSQHQINYDARILSLGSCFAQNISEKLSFFKFQNTANPFGIIFNPIAIERIVERSVNQEFYTEKDIFFHNEMWHCFEVHSKLSALSKDLFLENLNHLLKTTFSELQTISHCIITLGTSWIYRNNHSANVVANCHKIPQNQFTKELLSTATISKSIANTINLIESVNEKVRFIFTISPVRHLKDGFIENNVSKSNLITSLFKIIEDNAALDYFPSYEILLDELRDYRFYANDMLHPSQIAIEYIWKKFRESYIQNDLNPILNEIDSIQKSLLHKPFNENSQSHVAFLQKLQSKIEKIAIQFPTIKF